MMIKRNLLLAALALSFLTVAVHADSTERVRVIKKAPDSFDLIVERVNGDRLLIQHNRVCQSMSTEFPVELILEDGLIRDLKVGFNEMCEVYNSGPYSSNVTITKRIRTINAFVAEHEAQLIWNGNEYHIEYGEGCKNLRYFIDRISFIYTPENKLEGATLYLPDARGMCEITEANFLNEIEKYEASDSPIENLQYDASNNQSFFSWNEIEDEDKKWLILIAYSRYKLDPSDYHWRQMPNLRFSRTNSFTAMRLANEQTYYFYLAGRDGEGNVSPWEELVLTPIRTNRRIVNIPDGPEFEIEKIGGPAHYDLSWPNQGETTRKYILSLYVDGKRKLFKMLDGAEDSFSFDASDYPGSRYKMHLKSLPFLRYGNVFRDSIYWEVED